MAQPTTVNTLTAAPRYLGDKGVRLLQQCNQNQAEIERLQRQLAQADSKHVINQQVTSIPTMEYREVQPVNEMQPIHTMQKENPMSQEYEIRQGETPQTYEMQTLQATQGNVVPQEYGLQQGHGHGTQLGYNTGARTQAKSKSSITRKATVDKNSKRVVEPTYSELNAKVNQLSDKAYNAEVKAAELLQRAQIKEREVDVLNLQKMKDKLAIQKLEDRIKKLNFDLEDADKHVKQHKDKVHEVQQEVQKMESRVNLYITGNAVQGVLFVIVCILYYLKKPDVNLVDMEQKYKTNKTPNSKSISVY